MTENERFDHQGYVIVKGLFGSSQIDALTRIVDRVFHHWLTENRRVCIENRLINMHSLTSPEYFVGYPDERLQFFETLTSVGLTNLLDGMFGDGIYFHNTQLFFNPLENNRKPYWHRDLQYSPIDDAALKAEQRNLLALHVRIPSVRERGLELIPGTHRRWDTDLERNVRLELEEHQNDEALPGSVLIELDPGDVLIFSAQMIHRGNYRLNRSRKALDLCVGKAHPYTTPYLFKNTLPGAGELDRIVNNHWYRAALAIAGTTNPE